MRSSGTLEIGCSLTVPPWLARALGKKMRKDLRIFHFSKKFAKISRNNFDKIVVAPHARARDCRRPVWLKES
jgi:hypothetical protein